MAKKRWRTQTNITKSWMSCILMTAHIKKNADRDDDKHEEKAGYDSKELNWLHDDDSSHDIKNIHDNNESGNNKNENGMDESRNEAGRKG